MITKIRLLAHNVLAHPIAGLLWFVGAYRLGDWIHDRALPVVPDRHWYERNRQRGAS